MSLRRLLVACTLVILPTVAVAQETDGIAADGLLTDQDFFHLASCGAAPGTGCPNRIVRWPQEELTVSLLSTEVVPPTGFTERMSRALDLAIDQINAVEAGVRLRRVPEGWADIRVMPSNLLEGMVIEEVPGYAAYGVMGVGHMSYWWNERGEITTASILISTAILESDMQSVMLEELFQTLGPRFDVEGPAYEGLSILSQTSNETVTIAGQDARLLQWLYPPKK